MKEFSIAKTMGLFSLVLGGVFGSIYGIGVWRDYGERKEIARNEASYSRLLSLADVDSNGELSKIERSLLIERLNKNTLRMAGQCHYRVDWNEMIDSVKSNNRLLAGEGNSIGYAISAYERDRSN